MYLHAFLGIAILVLTIVMKSVASGDEEKG